MNIDELTLGQLKEIRSMISHESTIHQPYPIGKNVLVRTVTMIQVGRLVEVGPQELVLEDASWVADTERWSEMLNTGSVRENEPYPEGRVIVGRGAIIDSCEWCHALLREVK